MLQVQNLFFPPAEASPSEVFDELLSGAKFRMERIISTGQVTPQGEWYDQAQEEWVLLLKGAARLRFEEPPQEFALQPGDCLKIPAHVRHRVEWTDPAQTTIWLALHYQ